MVSNVDRIAQILLFHQSRELLHRDWVSECTGCDWTSQPTERVDGCRAEHRGHISALITNALHPRIETVEQLDALPFTAVVRETYIAPSGRDYGKVWERWMGDGDVWVQAGYPSDRGFPSGAIRLPARVLYTPEVDQ